LSIIKLLQSVCHHDQENEESNAINTPNHLLQFKYLFNSQRKSKPVLSGEGRCITKTGFISEKISQTLRIVVNFRPIRLSSILTLLCWLAT